MTEEHILQYAKSKVQTSHVEVLCTLPGLHFSGDGQTTGLSGSITKN